MSSTSIQVVSGRVLDPLNPNPDDILIEDIAHSLALQCRFAGHVRVPYSVAEHCVRVATIAPVEDKLEALMHDASEYALVDLPSPLKNSLFGDRYREVEENLMNVIADKFGFRRGMLDSVKKADNVLLCTEARDLLNARRDSDLWSPWLTSEPLSQIIEPWGWREAKESFLSYFKLLSERRTSEQAAV